MPELTAKAHKADVSAESRKRGYEASTITVRGLGIFFVLFCISGVLIHIGVWYLLKFYFAEKRSAEAPKSAVTHVEPRFEPRLQPSPVHDTNPPQDLATMHQGENRIFSHMGWEVVPGGTDVRIPSQIVRMLESRRAAPSTNPVLNAYEIPYAPATQPTGVEPAFGRQTLTPLPPYSSTQPQGAD